MTKPVGQDANATNVPPAEAAGDDPFGLSPWLKEMPDVPLHPLMAHPMAAMAATTAIGFGIAGQMAGAMLGVMQSAAERTKAMLDEAAELAAKAEAAKETAAPVKAKPELRVVPKAEPEMKVAREKSATPKAAEARPVRRAPAAKAAKADDLKAISGIGPKLEQVLNGMGLRRYADIAALTDADAARIEAELGLDGRIARDGWVEQARTLAKGRG
ncbi:NADH:ubiquinone oxidoreductase [Shinella zoogloeoides]|uniref:NADH:ubiquinone oxidoreductase n=1 Tax=Shinella zoogloeoides TaxID=352475 RepID=UPI0019D30592|nr:NADH:ubiquinone oxidoreductase [Shinella zoogloeoides]UEX82877.1 NADH:ubiquinone oxidoreductase [Shinella zoogloeoides]